MYFYAETKARWRSHHRIWRSFVRLALWGFMVMTSMFLSRSGNVRSVAKGTWSKMTGFSARYAMLTYWKI